MSDLSGKCTSNEYPLLYSFLKYDINVSFGTDITYIDSDTFDSVKSFTALTLNRPFISSLVSQ